MKFLLIKTMAFCLCFIFINCSSKEENIEPINEELDLNFLYDSSFIKKNHVNNIEESLNVDGSKVYRIFFNQKEENVNNGKAAVAPGEMAECDSEDCIDAHLKECYESGGTYFEIMPEKNSNHSRVICR